MIKKIRALARRILKPPLHKPQILKRFVVLGTDYGGWPIIGGEIDDASTILSIGLGEDLSFDLAAIEKFGSRVIGLDPTPKSLTWLQQQSLPDKFSFHPVGIAAKDGFTEFFPPKNPTHVSFSPSPRLGSQGQTPIKAKVMRLRTLLDKFDIATPDILKMDIEGFEYDVIADILKGDIRPKQLLVEFHHNIYPEFGKSHTREAVNILRKAGYKIFYVSSTGHEYGFFYSV